MAWGPVPGRCNPVTVRGLRGSTHRLPPQGVGIEPSRQGCFSSLGVLGSYRLVLPRPAASARHARRISATGLCRSPRVAITAATNPATTEIPSVARSVSTGIVNTTGSSISTAVCVTNR